jgi:hypothetical protein
MHQLATGIARFTRRFHQTLKSDKPVTGMMLISDTQASEKY